MFGAIELLKFLFEEGACRLGRKDVDACGEELQQIYHEQGMAIQKKSVGKADHSLLVQSILSWFIDEEWRQAVAACSSKEKETQGQPRVAALSKEAQAQEKLEAFRVHAQQSDGSRVSMPARFAA